jgi:hypothetical protein
MVVLYQILLVVIVAWLAWESVGGVQKIFARLVLLLLALGVGLAKAGVISYEAGSAITWSSVALLVVMIILRSRSIIAFAKSVINEINENK